VPSFTLLVCEIPTTSFSGFSSGRKPYQKASLLQHDSEALLIVNIDGTLKPAVRDSSQPRVNSDKRAGPIIRSPLN
jgi:hypothetical protein